MSLKSCFSCLSITLTFERKQSLGEEERSQEKMEQSEKEWKWFCCSTRHSQVGGKPGWMIRGCLQNSSPQLECEAIRGLPCLASLELQVSHLQETSLDFHFAERDQEAQAHGIASVLFSVVMASVARERDKLDTGELHKAPMIGRTCCLWWLEIENTLNFTELWRKCYFKRGEKKMELQPLFCGHERLFWHLAVNFSFLISCMLPWYKWLMLEGYSSYWDQWIKKY